LKLQQAIYSTITVKYRESI